MKTLKRLHFNSTSSFRNVRWPTVWAVVCLAVCMLGAGIFAMAQSPRIIGFDAPGGGTVPNPTYGMGTLAFSINDRGEIAGWYVDDNEVHDGYLRTADGRITTIEVPGATGTVAAGINDLGAITGTYTDANGISHGFLWIP